MLSPLLGEIKASTRDRDRLLETQQTVEHQPRMTLEAYHPAPVRLFAAGGPADHPVVRAGLRDAGGRRQIKTDARPLALRVATAAAARALT